MYQKYVFGLFILLRQGENFLLEIHNHSSFTFSQYSKESKNWLNFRNSCQPYSGQAFLPLRSGSLAPPLMSSGAIQASPMKLAQLW